jgi:alkylation response protein AidB-like acyl-CoA dehydrogenase
LKESSIMDFDFSDDQIALQDAVSRWVEKGYGFDRRRAIEQSGGFSKEAWQELCELGLPGLCTSEQFGGMGMGPVECMLTQQSLGHGMVLEPLHQSWIASALIERFASPEQRARWLPQLAGGKHLIGLAHQERQNRYSMQVQARIRQLPIAQWSLDATKIGVSAAAECSAFLVTAQTDTGLALYWVDRKQPAVGVNTHRQWDGSAAAQVTFDGAKAELVTTEGKAAWQLAQDCGIACTAAYAVGLMDTMLKLTTEYMNTRKQFGVPIASFQALRHRVADMKMQLELARSMSYYASLKLSAPDAERSAACSRAKVQLGQSMRFVGQQAIQLHGGIGVTQEYQISHCFRALTALEMAWGDTLHHLGQVSEHMTLATGVLD